MRYLFMILLSVGLFFHSSGQQNLEEGLPIEIADLVELNPLPESGTFITVQIVVIDNFKYLKYHDKLLVSFMFIKPVYVRFFDDLTYLSIGLFNNYSEASDLVSKIGCFYPSSGPFPVAYSSGKRIPLDSFTAGNIDEQVPNIKKAVKKLKKTIKRDYHRIQIGYYEKEGYEQSEQDKIDVLEKNGILLIEEPYENGRVLLTKRKIKSVKEALAFQNNIEELIDDDCELKKYYRYKKLKYYYVYFMHEYYDCLKSK